MTTTTGRIKLRLIKQIAYTRDALKALGKLLANTTALIKAKVGQYAADPASLANNVKALKGRAGLVRLRVGDWRVILRNAEVLLVVDLGSRGSIYD